MLVGAGELVKEGGFAAVLVAHQGKGQRLRLRQGIAGALGVELALLAKAGVKALPLALLLSGLVRRSVQGLCLDLLRVLETQGQLIAVDAQLHGIAHGRQLHHGEGRAGDHAHIQKMLPQGALAPHGKDTPALTGLTVSNGHNDLPHISCDYCVS